MSIDRKAPIQSSMTPPNEPATIREAYVQASSFLRSKAPQQDADRVAMLLLEHLTGWDKSALLLRWGEPFRDEWRPAWEERLRRKAAGEPVQYITGEQEFYGRPFRVTPAVLIPRPETEVLVERVAKEAARLRAPIRIADIGTGSGAIAVTLACQLPEAEVAAIDISAEALDVARQNAERLAVADRIRFLQGDLLEPLIAARCTVDALVSNPPYIATGEIACLQKEVRDFEPHTALDGGDDGLDLYRRMTAQIPQLPAAPRIVAFEVGFGQAAAVADMLAAIDLWPRIEIVPDLAGLERHVIAVREQPAEQ